MRNIRLPGVLVALGLVGLVAGTVAWMVALSGRASWDEYLAYAGPLIGFGLAGFAGWQWMLREIPGNADAHPSGMTRMMAVASAVTAAGWGGLTYSFFDFHRTVLQLTHRAGGSTAILDPHYRLRMAGGLSIIVGLLLAGLGFWIASGGATSSIVPLDEVTAAS